MSEDQSPITKKDLREALGAVKHDLREVLDAVVQSLLTEIRAEILASEQRSQEFARNIETNMLTAFHGHARALTARLHTGEIAAADLAIRMAALEDRMLNLECRRPPQ